MIENAVKFVMAKTGKDFWLHNALIVRGFKCPEKLVSEKTVVSDGKDQAIFLAT